MSYATPNDIRKSVNNALGEENYHIIVSHMEDEELVIDCFFNGAIKTGEVVKRLNEAIKEGKVTE